MVSMRVLDSIAVTATIWLAKKDKGRKLVSSTLSFTQGVILGKKLVVTINAYQTAKTYRHLIKNLLTKRNLSSWKRRCDVIA